MSDTMRVCASCGKPLAADAPQGVCPECLLKAGFSTAPGSGKGAQVGFVAPGVHEIAQLFPQLEILDLIGRGGMGAVYKARQPGLDRLVALKILPPQAGPDPGFAERFTREARALAKLNHPNIVAVFDFGRVRLPEAATSAAVGSATATSPAYLHYFIMEYVDGANLRQIEQAGKLSSREALQIIPQICEALQFAHDEGIVHRDIKPENVLVDKKGRVKIADFGLAKLLGIRAGDTRLTGARDVMGTPHYMAPEQVERPQTVDHRADIYSLGVVFYEMLTGELPLGRFEPPSSRARGMQIDVRLDEVVLHALEKQPERRYQHASEVKTDIENITGPAGKQAAPLAAAASEAKAKTELNSAMAQVRWPAMGLVAAGILNWILIPFVLYFAVSALSHPRADSFAHQFLPPIDLAGLGLAKVSVVGLMLMPFVLCSFLLYAALKMMRLEAYAAAIAGSIIAMVVTPGNIIGFPAGVWALVVLLRKEVKEAFHKKAAESGASGQISTRARWAWASVVVIVLALVALGLFHHPDRQPAIRAHVVRAFTTEDRPISGDVVRTEDGWVINCTGPQTFRLFEVPNPGVENCVVTYQAQLKSEGVVGKAYLEMWCQLGGLGEAYSRGLDKPISGSNDWSTYQIPFFLKAGEQPDLLRLNLVVDGSGKIFIKNIKVQSGPLPEFHPN
jgi:predicted Ser/Thr protein kinase